MFLIWKEKLSNFLYSLVIIYTYMAIYMDIDPNIWFNYQFLNT